MNLPDVSIILCTADRQADLAATLAAVAALRVPAGWEAELLVVDNAPAATSRRVVADALARLPGVRPGGGRFADARYVHEPLRGLCNARNRGLAETSGRIVLFLDDDVRPAADLIRQITAPIVENRADAVAGHVRLAPHLRRAWMNEQHLGRLAETSWRPGEAVERMVGANMAFRRDVLARVPGFDPPLDPGGLGFHGDTLFAWQLAEAGFRLTAAPAGAWAEHHPRGDRLTRGRMLDSSAKTGRSYGYLQHHWHHDAVPTPRRRVLTSALRLLAYRLKRPGLWLTPATAEGADLGEMHLVQSHCMARQYLVEHRRPRRYARRGLRLLDAPATARPRPDAERPVEGGVLA